MFISIEHLFYTELFVINLDFFISKFMKLIIDTAHTIVIYNMIAPSNIDFT
jgi:hypothetical protein